MSAPERITTCDICDLHRSSLTMTLPGIANDVMTCRRCYSAGAIPIWIAVTHTANLGGMMNVAPWWESLIHNTLAHLNVTRSEFDLMVELATTFAGVR